MRLFNTLLIVCLLVGVSHGTPNWATTEFNTVNVDLTLLLDSLNVTLDSIQTLQNEVGVAQADITLTLDSLNTTMDSIQTLQNEIGVLQADMTLTLDSLNTAMDSIQTLQNEIGVIDAVVDNIEDHLHLESNVYPTGAAGVQLTADNDAPWDLPDAYTEIIPVSTIVTEFGVYYVNVEAASADVTYELVLYCGTTEIGRVRFTAINAANGRVFSSIPIQTASCTANAQIQGKLMSSSGAADTATITLTYHAH